MDIIEKITALLLSALFLEGVVLVLELDEGILKRDTDGAISLRSIARAKCNRYLLGFFENLPRLEKALPFYPPTTY